MAYFVLAVLLFHTVRSSSDCSEPPLMLLSDHPKKTCTEISGSRNSISYSCTSLIKGYTKSRIQYCPVEVCMKNGTWSKPSISCALSECYVEDQSIEYRGYRTCTQSGRPCQRWDRQEPNKHRFKKDALFPDDTVQVAGSYCRDPGGEKGFPWCLANDAGKPKWEKCGVQKCSDLQILDRFCGSPKASDKNTDETVLNTTTVAKLTSLPPSRTTIATTTTTTVEIRETPGGQMGFRYRVMQGTVSKAKTYAIISARTIIECADKCSMTSKCHVFSYDKHDKSCRLRQEAGNNDDDAQTGREEFYRTGVKLSR